VTRSWRRAMVVALPFVLAWAVVRAAFAVLRDRLPDPLATHVGPGGQADGFTGLGAFLPVVTTLLLLPGLLMAAVAHRSRTALGVRRTLVASGYGTAAMLGYGLIALLRAKGEAAVWTRGVGSPVPTVVGAGTSLLGAMLTADRRGLSVVPWFTPGDRTVAGVRG
jgi:hypothetical protein